MHIQYIYISLKNCSKQIKYFLSAVRADRMRGGRNKFGPMYKRDRALKQQRKALIQASGFRIESSPPLVSLTHQRDFTCTGGLHPVPILSTTPLATAQNDSISYQPPSLCTPLHSNSPVATQYQCTSFSDGTVKSEHTNICTSSLGSAAGIYIDSDEVYSRPFSPHGPRMPQLVMEFVRCDPDELQLQNKITAHLQQEQGWEKHRNLITFSLMCLMADQTLFSIVEWARRSIFFKQLKVRSYLTLVLNTEHIIIIIDRVHTVQLGWHT